MMPKPHRRDEKHTRINVGNYTDAVMHIGVGNVRQRGLNAACAEVASSDDGVGFVKNKTNDDDDGCGCNRSQQLICVLSSSRALHHVMYTTTRKVI